MEIGDEVDSTPLIYSYPLTHVINVENMLTTSSHGVESARNKHYYIYGSGQKGLRDEEFPFGGHSNSISLSITGLGYTLPCGNSGSNIYWFLIFV